MTKKYILEGGNVRETDNLLEWAKALENTNRIVKQTELPNGKYISTVFLGIDHAFGQEKPLLFETMVFPKKGDWAELETERYSTIFEAELGHDVMVQKYT